MSYIYNAPQLNDLRKRIRRYMRKTGQTITYFSDRSVGYSLKPFLDGMIKRLSPRSVERIEQYLLRKTIAQKIEGMTTEDVHKMYKQQGGNCD